MKKYYNIRTLRNKELITATEYATLYNGILNNKKPYKNAYFIVKIPKDKKLCNNHRSEYYLCFDIVYENLLLPSNKTYKSKKLKMMKFCKEIISNPNKYGKNFLLRKS